jgi:hypothetical protein
VIEKTGIPTVSISLLREVTERVRPPRALLLDRPLGYPLGAANNIQLQNHIILAALELLRIPIREPLVVDFQDDFELSRKAGQLRVIKCLANV